MEEVEEVEVVAARHLRVCGLVLLTERPLVVITQLTERAQQPLVLRLQLTHVLVRHEVARDHAVDGQRAARARRRHRARRRRAAAEAEHRRRRREGAAGGTPHPGAPLRLGEHRLELMREVADLAARRGELAPVGV